MNGLLVAGFYLLNLGLAFLLLDTNVAPYGASVPALLVDKLGSLFLSLGLIHLVNLLVLSRIRRRMLTPAPPRPQRQALAPYPYWSGQPAWGGQPAAWGGQPPAAPPQ